MNAIAIKPKTVEVMPARTANFTNLTWRTNDDAFQRRLQIVVNNAVAFTVTGAEYDALGQWTDETIRDLILARFGLEVATP
jgi:hypothetical protein